MDGKHLFDRPGVSEGWVRRCSPNGDNCVEVNQRLPGVVGVRDSTQPDGTVLVVDRAQWGDFLAAVRAGQFDH